MPGRAFVASCDLAQRFTVGTCGRRRRDSGDTGPFMPGRTAVPAADGVSASRTAPSRTGGDMSPGGTREAATPARPTARSPRSCSSPQRRWKPTWPASAANCTSTHAPSSPRPSPATRQEPAQAQEAPLSTGGPQIVARSRPNAAAQPHPAARRSTCSVRPHQPACRSTPACITAGTRAASGRGPVTHCEAPCGCRGRAACSGWERICQSWAPPEGEPAASPMARG